MFFYVIIDFLHFYMSFHDINSKNNTKPVNIAKGFITLRAKIRLGSLELSKKK